MPDDVTPSRTVRIITAATERTSKVNINPEDTELKELYEQLAEAAIASSAAQRTTEEKPSDNAFSKFRELDQQVDAIIKRINRILR
jgi:hypothetical protein